MFNLQYLEKKRRRLYYYLFFLSSNLVTRETQMNKWGVQGSNPGPCTYYALFYPLPNELNGEGFN